MWCRITRCGWRLGLVAVLAALLARAEDPRTVAIVTALPVSTGWGAFRNEDALVIAAGTILRETLKGQPAVAVLPWSGTSAYAGLVAGGLYQMAAGPSYAGWRELVAADVYVELDATEGVFVYRVHNRERTWEGRTADPFKQPKKAIAPMVLDAAAALGLRLSEEVVAQVKDPETKNPALFMAWARWLEFAPSIYNKNPWEFPNADASLIIEGDLEFMRGLAWALPMKLRPYMVGTSPSRSNPAVFDLNVLRVLQSRFAEQVIAPYNARLQADVHLRRDSFRLLRVEGMTVDVEDAEDGEKTELVPSAAARPGSAIATTPRLRHYVCLALSGIEDKRTIERITDLLADDPAVTVREAAATSLGGFKPGPVVLAALTKGARDPAASVRLAALRALIALKQEALPVFTEALKDADAQVRWCATATVIDKAPEPATARRLLLDVLATNEGPEALRSEMRTFALNKAAALFPQPDELRASLTPCLESRWPGEQLAALQLVRHYRLKELAPVVKQRLTAPAPAVRAAATAVLSDVAPDALTDALPQLADDPAGQVHLALLNTLTVHGTKEQLPLIRRLLKSPDETVRRSACDAIYRLYAAERPQMIAAMLYDPSMRCNFAAIRLLQRRRDAALLADAAAAVANHPNEYVRAQLLLVFDQMNEAQAHDLAVAALQSPFFIVRLYAADVLERRGVAADAPAIGVALGQATNPWLRLALADALAKVRGEAPPPKVRLGLGQREHTEGGELPNGWQLWLGLTSKSAAENRKLVEQGYRFGAVLTVPLDRSLGSVQAWDNSRACRNTYLLHVLNSLERLKESAPSLYYLCLFDEPHGAGGADHEDQLRAFLLEMNRPDLAAALGRGEAVNLDPELQAYWSYYGQRSVASISNWVVKVLRLTLQRQFPDLRIFPQSLSYFGGAAVEAWADMDTDGDYSWRYDYNNLMGHYGRGAVWRALHPEQPAAMVTWMGLAEISQWTGDVLFTSSGFAPGPWRLRDYMGTRAALALYSSGIEPSFFTNVGYKPRADRQRDTGGILTYPLTPWSPELTKTINHMIAGDKVLFWDKVRDKIEADVYRKYHPDDGANNPNLEVQTKPGGNEELPDLEDTPAKMRKEVEELYAKEVEKAFLPTMIGCSWLNLFNTDNTRAFSNLPKPDRRPRNTLVILSRQHSFYGDGPTFVMPGLALAAEFDMVPNYQCLKLADPRKYDTLMVLDSPYGVTSDLVTKVNTFLRERAGLLYVCGNLNTKKALFPALTDDELRERFLWEDQVTVTATATVEEKATDEDGKEQTVRKAPRLAAFTAPAGASQDETGRVRCTYTGQVTPVVTWQQQTILARWQDPARAKGVVIFDGVAEAGPGYTAALEAAVLAADQQRGATIKRNPWWGHIGYENEAFVLDVATAGYGVLQAARPRQHRGIDIITGDINPKVVHGEGTMILKNYLGPYAGGLGDWSVMARSALLEMKLQDANTLRVHSRGVARVSHIGDLPLRLQDASGFTEAKDQLEVWKQMWQDQRAWSVNPVPGGWELHFSSPDPVVIVAAAK